MKLKRLKLNLLILNAFLVFMFSNYLNGNEKANFLRLSAPLGMIRADLYQVKITQNPKAVLVLAPIYNGNGKYLVENTKWQEFAQNNELDLVGLSFASKDEDLRNGKGYYYVQKGSGKTLVMAWDSGKSTLA